MTDGDHIERELALFKLKLSVDDQETLVELTKEFGARMLDDYEGYFTVELIGDSSEIDRFMTSFPNQVEILTVVRSGAMAVARGAPVLTPT